MTHPKIKPLFTSFFAWLASVTFAYSVVAADPVIPFLSYLDGTGEIYTLNPSKNKLTAVHFWATWCAPCIEELPDVNRAQSTYGSKGLSIVAISMDNDIKNVWAFFREHHIGNLRGYIDNNGSSFSAFKLQGLPTTIFVNQSGKEVGRVEGPMDWHENENRSFIESQLNSK